MIVFTVYVWFRTLGRLWLTVDTILRFPRIEVSKKNKIYLTNRLKRNPIGRKVPKKATAERQSQNGKILEIDLTGVSKNFSEKKMKILF